MSCVQLKASSIQLKKYSQHRLENDNDVTDHIPAIIHIASSNGVAIWSYSYSTGSYLIYSMMWRKQHWAFIMLTNPSVLLLATMWPVWLVPTRRSSSTLGRVPSQGGAISESSRERCSSLYHVGAVTLQWSITEPEKTLADVSKESFSSLIAGQSEHGKETIVNINTSVIRLLSGDGSNYSSIAIGSVVVKQFKKKEYCCRQVANIRWLTLYHQQIFVTEHDTTTSHYGIVW